MGTEIPENERNIRFELFHESIYEIEKEIKAELNNQNIKDKKYSKFGLINQGIFKKYPFLLKEKFDKNDVKNKIFNYKDLVEKTEKRDFRYVNKEFKFTFPVDFFFVKSDFMELIRENIGKSIKKSDTNYKNKHCRQWQYTGGKYGYFKCNLDFFCNIYLTESSIHGWLFDITWLLPHGQKMVRYTCRNS